MSISDRIWARKSPTSRAAFSLLKRIARVDVPVIPGLHHFLLAERRFRRGPLHWLVGKLYREPLFRMMCAKVGSGLLLYEGIPKILGNLNIQVGDNVTLSGEQTWISGGSGMQRNLVIGSNTYLGHAVQIISGDTVQIGEHVLVANRVVLNGYDGHPLDPIKRSRNEPAGIDGSGPIRLSDYCWIGNDVTILKNVVIGRGAVVASGSVVTSDVPDLVVVAGIPARVVREIPAPAEWVR